VFRDIGLGKSRLQDKIDPLSLRSLLRCFVPEPGQKYTFDCRTKIKQASNWLGFLSMFRSGPLWS
jgi:hypothetical protein